MTAQNFKLNSFFPVYISQTMFFFYSFYTDLYLLSVRCITYQFYMATGFRCEPRSSILVYLGHNVNSHCTWAITLGCFTNLQTATVKLTMNHLHTFNKRKELFQQTVNTVKNAWTAILNCLILTTTIGYSLFTSLAKLDCNYNPPINCYCVTCSALMYSLCVVTSHIHSDECSLVTTKQCCQQIWEVNST